LVRYSEGDFVAIARNFEVSIYDTNTLRILVKYQFADIVSQLEWSPDG
jgi:hypothetical protein